MSLPIHLRPEAVHDIEEICEYLESQLAGLSQTFLLRLREKLDRIRLRPETYGQVWKNVRATTVKNFRYVLYFRTHADKIEVLAVIHGHRHPSAWKKRI